MLGQLNIFMYLLPLGAMLCAIGMINHWRGRSLWGIHKTEIVN